MIFYVVGSNMYFSRKNQNYGVKYGALKMRDIDKCGLENSRLLIIEQDVKTLIGITSSLKTEFSRLDKLEREASELLNFRGKILGSVSILYFLFTVFGGFLFGKVFNRL